MTEINEGLVLLKNLLNNEQSKLQTISSELDYKNNSLIVIVNQLKILSLEKGLSKKHKDAIIKIVDAGSEVYKDLYALDCRMFPTTAFLFGFEIALKNFIQQFSLAEKILITYTSGLPKILAENKVKTLEVKAFSLCVDIIENLRMLGKREIKVKCKANKKFLEIEITAPKLTIEQEENPEGYTNLLIIKGKLVWLNAEERPQMNHKNIWKFRLPFMQYPSMFF